MASAAFEAKYVTTGKVKFVYHDYPLNIHPNAIPASEAARCAADQNAFWPMHDLLFDNQSQWSVQSDPTTLFAGYAQQLKLDSAKFSTCVTNHTHRDEILSARSAGDAMQLTGTPSFAVNGILLNTQNAQTVNDIVNLLDQAVDKALNN